MAVRKRLYLDDPPEIIPEKLSDADVLKIDRECERMAGEDFLLFIKNLFIPSAHGPMIFEECIAPFQLDCFKSLAPSLHAVRDGIQPPKRRYWIERTKKAGKDSDLALCLLWLMAYPKRPILCQVSAANQQQAGIIKRRAKDILHYNPWLNDRIKIQLNRIIGLNNLGEVVIEATGSSGAKQGDTPDLLILNELVHVDKWGVNETHMHNADGVPQGVVIISTNAGIRGTKAWQWRQNAIENKDRWTVHLWKGVAPWISNEDVQDAARRDPVGAEYSRLWKGEWISGIGNAVPDSKINNCFCLSGPTYEPEQGWQYIAGLDLGISHDHAGIALVGVQPQRQRIKVCQVHGFAPSIPNDQGQLEVDAAAVERLCLDLFVRFRVRWFGYDPAAGGSFMAQSLRKRNVPMREMSFASPTVQNQMALSFVQLVLAGRLECYEDDEGRLRRDFGKFNIVAKIPTGYKLEAMSDEWGHADVGVALIITLPEAINSSGINLTFSDDDVIYEEQSEAKPEEYEAMPDDLKGICELYDDLKHNSPRRREMQRKKLIWQ